MKRRKFLQVAGVAGAGVAAASCGPQDVPDHWVPYASTPEDITPGIPTWYASTCKECPAGCGILVKTREGRPIKIEGNPRHPVNRGKLCARGQAALQGLYDPDRVTQPMKRTGTAWAAITWDQAETEVATALGAAASAGADRVALLTGAGSGPLDRITDAFTTAFKSKHRLRYEAFAYEPIREANRLTFGMASLPNYDFGAAKYVLSFGADFLETWISPTSNQIGFAAAHSPHAGGMAKYVAVETRRGNTAYSADEWIAPKPGTEHLVALAIANSVAKGVKNHVGDVDALRGFLAPFDSHTVSGQSGVPAEVIDRIATEFAAASPSLAVGPGVAHQTASATQLAVAVNILNVVAGNIGKTVSFPAASVWDHVGSFKDLSDLLAAMGAGTVDVALVHGANPAYSYPGTGFAEAFAKVKLKVSLSSYLDETASLCDLILPDHHALESWDIVEPMTGVSGTVQPAIRPIHSSKQSFDVLVALAQKAGKSIAPAGVTTAREMVAKTAGAGLAAQLQHGGAFTTTAARPVRLARDYSKLAFTPASFTGAADGLVLLATPSPMLYDGRGANKPWLNEIPDPAAKITWQTWAEIHPETAARLGLANGDIVKVTAPNGQTIRPAVYVYPGVRRDVVAIPIGRGHKQYGRFAANHGSNPFHLLAPLTDSSGALVYCQARVSVTREGGNYPLATTEGSSRQMGRGISRLVPIGELTPSHSEERGEDLTEPERNAIGAVELSQGKRRDIGVYEQPHAKWEMTIDLSKCTGCGACVAACHAENNIPTVGPEQVIRSREMSWIRIERYFEGDTSGTDWQVAQIPMLCQQCSNAPCEPVCPVYAAYHTPDGLNGQIYNRCVGTRYCANNCPYKVRYFNFWDYGSSIAPMYAFPGPLVLQLNPDVTVRTKGVMEKCTFCVQRIRFAQNDARVRGIDLTDGAVTTACAQTCPSGAIVFGNAHETGSAVNKSKRADANRAYTVFEQLNTKPGITYLSRVVHAGTREA
ncbi:MAG TPA: molybdopterin-dependent oxidoreductase [Gemmatimonadales bacterium]